MIFHSYVSLPEGIKGDFHCHVWWPECRFEHAESLHMLAIWCLFRHQMTCNPDTRCICLCQVSIQLVISYNFSFLYIYNSVSYIYIYIHTYTYRYLLLQMQSRYVQKIAIRKDSETDHHPHLSGVSCLELVSSVLGNGISGLQWWSFISYNWWFQWDYTLNGFSSVL